MILKEFANVLSAAQVSIAAAGSTNADATAVTSYNTIVTAADGTKGVILPAAGDVGEVFLITNNVAQILKIYPPASSSINGATATTGAYSAAASAPTLIVRTTATALTAVGKF